MYLLKLLAGRHYIQFTYRIILLNIRPKDNQDEKTAVVEQGRSWVLLYLLPCLVVPVLVLSWVWLGTEGMVIRSGVGSESQYSFVTLE